MFWPPRLKMSRSFIQNCCWITPNVSRHQRWKTCVKKRKVNLILRGVGNSFMIWLILLWSDWSWPPHFTTDLRHWWVDRGVLQYSNASAQRPRRSVRRTVCNSDKVSIYHHHSIIGYYYAILLGLPGCLSLSAKPCSYHWTCKVSNTIQCARSSKPGRVRDK